MNLVNYLRQSVLVQDPNITPQDPEFLSMTDEDLKEVLEFSLYKINPNASLENLSKGDIYPLILVAKKELYSRLAVKNAPLVTIGFGETALKYDLRFEHYLKLIKQVDEEYNKYLQQNIYAESAEVLLDSRYYSKRYYDLSNPPIIELFVDSVYSDKVELSWGVSGVDKFYNYLIYIDTNPILDKYSEEKISSTAQLVKTIYDVHETFYRIEGLQPNTKYYVLVVVQNKNGLKGYSEVSFTTLIG